MDVSNGNGMWQVKRKRAGVGRQMRSRDRPEGRGAVSTANLSRNWVFQLEPGYRLSRDPPLPGLRVCLAQVPGAPFFPSPAKILLCVYTEPQCSCHANWICQMEG